MVEKIDNYEFICKTDWGSGLVWICENRVQFFE